MPVGLARAAVASTCAIGMAGDRGVPARSGTLVEPGATAATPAWRASVTLPQAWHSPQRPAHFGARHPHSEHSYIVVTADLPMAGTVAPATDTPPPAA
jgi:hypothetical protein